MQPNCSITRILADDVSLTRGVEGSVAVDASGRLYVADTQSHRVVVLSPGGTLLRNFTDGFWSPTECLRTRSAFAWPSAAPSAWWR